MLTVKLRFEAFARMICVENVSLRGGPLKQSNREPLIETRENFVNLQSDVNKTRGRKHRTRIQDSDALKCGSVVDA